MEAPELNDYREHLLDALDDQPRRAAAERPGLLQMLVNHERVGTLDCAHADPSFAFTARERSIQHFEIRRRVRGIDRRVCRARSRPQGCAYPSRQGSATIQVHNHFDGGSLQMRYEPAPRWWSQVSAAIGVPFRIIQTSSKRAPPSGRLTTAFAQIVLAVGVVALLAERIPSWMGSDDRAHQLEEELAARQSTQEQIDRVHQQLAQLIEAQDGDSGCFAFRAGPDRAIE